MNYLPCNFLSKYDIDNYNFVQPADFDRKFDAIVPYEEFCRWSLLQMDNKIGLRVIRKLEMEI